MDLPNPDIKVLEIFRKISIPLRKLGKRFAVSNQPSFDLLDCFLQWLTKRPMGGENIDSSYFFGKLLYFDFHCTVHTVVVFKTKYNYGSGGWGATVKLI